MTVRPTPTTGRRGGVPVPSGRHLPGPLATLWGLGWAGPPRPGGAVWGREVTALHLGDLRAGQRAWVGVRFAEVETPKQDWSPVKPEPPLRRSQAQGAGPASSPALVHPARVCAEVTAGRGPGGMLWPPPRPGLFGP